MWGASAAAAPSGGVGRGSVRRRQKRAAPRCPRGVVRSERREEEEVYSTVIHSTPSQGADAAYCVVEWGAELIPARQAEQRARSSRVTWTRVVWPMASTDRAMESTRSMGCRWAWMAHPRSPWLQAMSGSVSTVLTLSSPDRLRADPRVRTTRGPESGRGVEMLTRALRYYTSQLTAFRRSGTGASHLIISPAYDHVPTAPRSHQLTRAPTFPFILARSISLRRRATVEHAAASRIPAWSNNLSSGRVAFFASRPDLRCSCGCSSPKLQQPPRPSSCHASHHRGQPSLPRTRIALPHRPSPGLSRGDHSAQYAAIFLSPHPDALLARLPHHRSGRLSRRTAVDSVGLLLHLLHLRLLGVFLSDSQRVFDAELGSERALPGRSLYLYPWQVCKSGSHTPTSVPEMQEGHAVVLGTFTQSALNCLAYSLFEPSS